SASPSPPASPSSTRRPASRTSSAAPTPCSTRPSARAETASAPERARRRPVASASEVAAGREHLAPGVAEGDEAGVEEQVLVADRAREVGLAGPGQQGLAVHFGRQGRGAEARGGRGADAQCGEQGLDAGALVGGR